MSWIFLSRRFLDHDSRLLLLLAFDFAELCSKSLGLALWFETKKSRRHVTTAHRLLGQDPSVDIPTLSGAFHFFHRAHIFVPVKNRETTWNNALKPDLFPQPITSWSETNELPKFRPYLYPCAHCGLQYPTLPAVTIMDDLKETSASLVPLTLCLCAYSNIRYVL